MVVSTMIRKCQQPPSPLLWMTAPTILAILFLRIYFFPTGLSKRRLGRAKWAMLCHLLSIATVSFWIAHECSVVIFLCYMPCTESGFKVRLLFYAAANFLQYFFLFAKWKTVHSKSLLGASKRGTLLLASFTLILCVLSFGIFVSLMMTYNHFQSTCDVDSLTRKKIAIFSGLDVLTGIFFLAMFLHPLCVSRSSMMQHQNQQNGNANVPTTTAGTINKVIKRNLAGAMISQFAQTTTLLLFVFVGREGLHLIRLTICLNLLGISVMLNDTGRVWSVLKSKVFFAAMSQKRALVVPFGSKQEGDNAKNSSPDHKNPADAQAKDQNENGYEAFLLHKRGYSSSFVVNFQQPTKTWSLFSPVQKLLRNKRNPRKTTTYLYEKGGSMAAFSRGVEKKEKQGSALHRSRNHAMPGDVPHQIRWVAVIEQYHN